ELFLLPAWIHLLVVILFALAIFYFAVTRGVASARVEEAVRADEVALAEDPELAGCVLPVTGRQRTPLPPGDLSVLTVRRRPPPPRRPPPASPGRTRALIGTRAGT